MDGKEGKERGRVGGKEERDRKSGVVVGGGVKGESYRWKKGGEREKKWVEECFGIDEKWGKERG